MIKFASLFFLFSLTAECYAAPHVTLPPKGSLFVNTFFVTDSSGAVVPPSVMPTGMPDDSQYVIQSGIKFNHKSNVIALLGPSHPDTTYISYAKNGDIFLLNTTGSGKWEHLYFGARKGKLIITPTSIQSGHTLGKDYTSHDHNEIKVMGMDTVSVGDVVVPSIRMVQMVVMAYTQGAGKHSPEATFVNAYNYWFSPEIGYFTRINFGWNGKYFLNQQLKYYQPGRH